MVNRNSISGFDFAERLAEVSRMPLAMPYRRSLSEALELKLCKLVAEGAAFEEIDDVAYAYLKSLPGDMPKSDWRLGYDCEAA